MSGQIDKDAILMQFLGMTEDRVDTEVATALLEANNWDLQRSVDQLFGDDAPPGGAAGADMDSVIAEASGQGSASAISGGSDDRHLAQVLQDSMRDSGPIPEDEQMAEAIRASQNMAESMERRAMMAQQDAEFEESQLADQMRQAQEESMRLEEERVRKAEEESRIMHEIEEKTQRSLVQNRAAAVPPEPQDSDPEKLSLMFRMPDGSRKQRKFVKSNTIAQLYAYVDGLLLDMEEDLVGKYTLGTSFPRATYERSDMTLSDSKLENQMALIIQRQ